MANFNLENLLANLLGISLVCLLFRLLGLRDRFHNLRKIINNKELVSFGKYLLSEEREKKIKEMHPEDYETHFREVYDADIANWRDINNPVKRMGKVLSEGLDKSLANLK